MNHIDTGKNNETLRALVVSPWLAIFGDEPVTVKGCVMFSFTSCFYKEFLKKDLSRAACPACIRKRFGGAKDFS
jgi:hypothetical protein